jgi:glycosyltransferase involved in cell wall biosynthesis
MLNCFIYWDKGIEAMPTMIKYIYEHNLFISLKYNFNLVLISDDNIEKYIDVHNRFFELKSNFKSDIIRYNILHKYGGIWLDTDVIILKNLNEIYSDFLETKYMCMLDIEHYDAIGCASIFMKENTICSKYCVDYVNNYLDSDKPLEWGCIGPNTVRTLYNEYPDLIKLNTYEIVKNGCNFISRKDDPGHKKDKWIMDQIDAEAKAQDIYINENCYYVITWTIYRKNDIKDDIINFVFKNKMSVFYHLLNNCKKDKIGNIIVNNTNQVLKDITLINHSFRNGYSFLLRIKNEESTIEKCILDIVDIADEIIVVDNNSSDNTLNIILDLEKKYNNIFVYQYKIDIPRCGIEHIQNFKNGNKDNTLTNYYNWTLSKATFNKKIKWDGDFYAIKKTLDELLNKYRNYSNIMAVWFSGLTLFIHNNDKYFKNYSYYNEYRLFCNESEQIWNDCIIRNGGNFCETSQNFVDTIDNRQIYEKPIYFEIKNTNKDEFSGRSTLFQDGRDKIDFEILENLSNNKTHDLLIKTIDPYQSYLNFKLNKLSRFVCKKILLLIDEYDWAFDNISKSIIKNSNEYYFEVTPYKLFIQKIKKKEDIYKYNHIIFFGYWGANIDILDYFYSKEYVNSINLCIYDYSLWINNHNKKQEIIFFKNLLYFLKKIDNCMYASPFIYNLIKEKNLFDLNNMFKCYDGVDIELFNYMGYDNTLLTKDKLNIGWIGNSNPNNHGINNGFLIIKKVVEKMKEKFNFNPQDSYTCTYITHDKIPNYLEYIDIIVCFSMAEGTPNQILESSSCGKCWISTKVGIVEELNNTIENNKCGIIIDRDEKALENALNYLYNNRNLIIEFGKNGRNAIEKSWSLKNTVNNFYSLIKKYDENNKEITFNILIATVGRPSLQNMINSLNNQLNENDCLTIVFDGHLSLPSFDLSQLKCKVNQYFEPINLGYWGHAIRNKYSDLLEKRDFIMHADDDDIYIENTFNFFRKKCINTNTLYIGCMKFNKTIIPKNNIIKEGNIGTPCGIIPYDLNLKGKWLERSGGDGAFYEQISQYTNKILFLEKVFYIIRPTKLEHINDYDNNINSDISNNIISIDKSNNKGKVLERKFFKNKYILFKYFKKC